MFMGTEAVDSTRDHTRIIAFTNQKGGTGKTTSVVNIGAGLTQLKKKVLLIDLDPQASLSISLKITDPEFDIEDLLNGTATLKQVIQHRGKLDVIPSSIYFIEDKLTGNDLLGKALKNISGYDFILIDPPPHLGMSVYNAVKVSRELIIPTQTEYLALQGIKKLLEVYESFKKNLNPTVSISGIIPVRYDSRKILNRDILEQLQKTFGDIVFDPIRDNVAVAEAPYYGKSIFDHAPRSHGAEDYLKICKAIIKRG